ncbi:MAG: deoxyguanosinetriphosphate triphosphohydrolase [Hyphomicrobiaceae bacterium]
MPLPPLAPGARAPAPYAASSIPGRGRLHAEPACPTRSPFQRDRDRVVHATAFRRLTHKTQMFIYHEGDHYRTRLTHSLEVAQIARTVARQLRLDEDLAEALALAHDLGHPPFGHAGERALDRLMKPYGGFDHNVQSFRLVTRLERTYMDFDGLNLTWECLEGLVKHNGPPLLDRGPAGGTLVHALRHFDARLPLDLHRQPSAEAQVAALADDVAWHSHDIDDGLRAGLIRLEDLDSVPLVEPIVRQLRSRPPVEASRMFYAVTRQLITDLISDIVTESSARLAEMAPDTADVVRAADQSIVAFSPAMQARLAELRHFLFARLYRHARVERVMVSAEGLVEDLIERYRADPGQMPGSWAAASRLGDERRRNRVIADFVAGMTDRYAIAEHRRLFDATPDLR